MKKLVLLLLVLSSLSFTFFSCTQNNDQVINIAQEYAIKNILPLFPDAKIVNEYPLINVGVDTAYLIVDNKDIKIIKGDFLEKMEILNHYEKSLIDKKESYAKYRLGNDTERGFKLQLLKNAIEQSTIDAIENAKIGDGFYNVKMAIKFGESEYADFNIIVTHDNKVLNIPVDTTELYSYNKSIFE